MNKPKILVTGATGKTGKPVVAGLLEKGFPVRALVRKMDARSEALKKLGAEIMVADMTDPLQMVEAMKGVRRAYYCPPIDPFMMEMTAAFANAAKEAKLEAIVGLSQWLASPNHPSFFTRQVWDMEQTLSSLEGIAYVNLNPGWFADNNLRLIDFAALLGIFPVVTGHSRNAPPSNEDIARCAVALLTDPLPHTGKSYRVTGPKLLSAYDMVEVMRKVFGKRVIPITMPLWMLNKAARQQHETAFTVGSLLHYVEDHRQGAFEYNAPTNVVQELTGSPAEDFETTVRRYAALPFAQRTLRNRIRAFINFNLVPFIPAYKLKSYESKQGFPIPPNPQYAMQSDAWKASHAPQSANDKIVPINQPQRKII